MTWGLKLVLTNLGLALVWMVLTAHFGLLNFLFGLALGFMVLRLFLAGAGPQPSIQPRIQLGPARLAYRAWLGLKLTGVVLAELLLSALRVAALVVRPNIKAHIRPAFINYPLRVTSDAQITLLANIITLTPGTLSVEVSADKKILMIHALVAADEAAVIADISSTFEDRIMAIFAAGPK